MSSGVPDIAAAASPSLSDSSVPQKLMQISEYFRSAYTAYMRMLTRERDSLFCLRALRHSPVSGYRCNDSAQCSRFYAVSLTSARGEGGKKEMGKAGLLADGLM